MSNSVDFVMLFPFAVMKKARALPPSPRKGAAAASVRVLAYARLGFQVFDDADACAGGSYFKIDGRGAHTVHAASCLAI
jgi:hypothetical protein